MITDNPAAEIIGTLYKSEEGDIMLLNDAGAHTVVIDQTSGVPLKTNDTLYVVSHEVSWNDGSTEIWTSDIWDDLVEDIREEEGDEAADKLKESILSTFQSVILTAI
tara:strand:- start:2754 stop:3074 length:321 start_codon:yes stop_codon:yes gene_type:complete